MWHLYILTHNFAHLDSLEKAYGQSSVLWTSNNEVPGLFPGAETWWGQIYVYDICVPLYSMSGSPVMH